MNLLYVLDTPKEKEFRVGDEIRVSGWCFSKDVQIEGLEINFGDLILIPEYKLERPDVADYYNDSSGSRFSGFSINIVAVKPGDFQINLVAIGDDGQDFQVGIGSVTIHAIPFHKKCRIWFKAWMVVVSRASQWFRMSRRFPSRSEWKILVRKALNLTRQQTGSSKILNRNNYSPGRVEDRYACWIRVNQLTKPYLLSLKKRFSQQDNPVISIVMPVYNPDLDFLGQAVNSIRDQLYDKWELCIADDASTKSGVKEFLTDLTKDPRIHIVFREKNGNISAATNSALSISSGEFVFFMDQDDLLEVNCLAEIAVYLTEHPDTDVLYTDDDKIDSGQNRYAPQFKPDWSPELLLSYMYFSHAFVVRASLIQKVGGLRSRFDGSQDYDLALRVTEYARHVGHIPMILYHWRAVPGSTAASGTAKPDSIEAGRNAVQDCLDRRKIPAVAYQPDWARVGGVGVFRHRFANENLPEVTIIIPSKNNIRLLKRCVTSILTKTEYPCYRILIIDNESDDAETIRGLNQLVDSSDLISKVTIGNPDGKFSFAYLNNQAVKQVESPFILFLNDDTEVRSAEWLARMAGYLLIPGVGTVGAKLIFPDKRIQHAGIVHGLYDGYAGVSRNYAAITAACMLTPRDLFLKLGGFNEEDFSVAFNDVDYCYRVLSAGERNVYCPEAELIHYEGYSRGFHDNPAERLAFRRRYRDFQDPYYNINLSLENERFEIEVKCTLPFEKPARPIRSLMCGFNLNLEGAPFSQYEMTMALRDQNIITPLVFSPEDGPLRERYRDAGIEVWADKHPLRNVSTELQYQNAVEKFAQWIRSERIELVYANTLQTFYAIDAARKAGVPSVWNIRESESWHNYFDFLGTEIRENALRCFQYPYRIVYVAHATREVFRELDIHHNATVIHNGLNFSRLTAESEMFDREKERQALGVLPEERLVLTVGTVCERKGQLDIVHAMEKLDEETLACVKFLVVGDRAGVYSHKLHRAYRKLPDAVREKIQIIPEQKDVFRYYKAADIFVCTSRLESYPRVILEAMAFNLPIITTPVMGIAEQVIENVNGLFYPPGDTAVLARKINELLSDHSRLMEMGMAGSIILKALTDFDEMTGGYGDIFREAYFSQFGGTND